MASDSDTDSFYDAVNSIDSSSTDCVTSASRLSVGSINDHIGGVGTDGGAEQQLPHHQQQQQQSTVESDVLLSRRERLQRLRCTVANENECATAAAGDDDGAPLLPTDTDGDGVCRRAGGREAGCERTPSPQLSMTGSPESAGRSAHPFRIVETGQQSLFSQHLAARPGRAAPPPPPPPPAAAATAPPPPAAAAATASAESASAVVGDATAAAAVAALVATSSASVPAVVTATPGLQVPDVVSSAKMAASCSGHRLSVTLSSAAVSSSCTIASAASSVNSSTAPAALNSLESGGGGGGGGLVDRVVYNVLASNDIRTSSRLADRPDRVVDGAGGGGGADGGDDLPPVAPPRPRRSQRRSQARRSQQPPAAASAPAAAAVASNGTQFVPPSVSSAGVLQLSQPLSAPQHPPQRLLSSTSSSASHTAPTITAAVAAAPTITAAVAAAAPAAVGLCASGPSDTGVGGCGGAGSHEKAPLGAMDVKTMTRGQCLVLADDNDSVRAPAVTGRQLLTMHASCPVGSGGGGRGGGSLAALDQLERASVHSDSSATNSVCSGYSDLVWQQHQLQQQLQQQQARMLVRTKTNSGRRMTDKEILDQVSVLNLDTGERMPLSTAEERLCINPLSLQIMRMTSSFHCDPAADGGVGGGSGGAGGGCCGGNGGGGCAGGGGVSCTSDQLSLGGLSSSVAGSLDSHDTKLRRRQRLQRYLRRKVGKVKDRAEVLSHRVTKSGRRHDKQDATEPAAALAPAAAAGGLTVGLPAMKVPMKAASCHKGPYEFDQMILVQSFSGEHCGPVWCMKFSLCGRLLASAGQDHVMRVWVLKSAHSYFSDMRAKYSQEQASPTPSQESLVSQHSDRESLECGGGIGGSGCDEEEVYAPFVTSPLCRYSGHTADLLDISWSKNYFILSSSMDKTVRLWHISRRECLVCFQHIEFVTAIAFHPRDDRFFLSGSMDGKLRMWNIPDKKVTMWNELDGQPKLITAANFCQNGRFAVVGTFDGRCVFYSTDQLKYHTQIHVRSSRGRNRRGRKISGIEPLPGEDKVMVTSNDSRVRVYDLRDLSLSCKYKGLTNYSSQIKASVSHDGKFIVSGSEDQCVYIWKTRHDYSKFYSSARRDRNGYWEGMRAHEAQVTCALFSPHPDVVFQRLDTELARRQASCPSDFGAQLPRDSSTSPAQLLLSPAPPPPPAPPGNKPDSLERGHKAGSGGTLTAGYVLATADFNGTIKVFLNRTKPKHSSLPMSPLV